jgi:hypothetical protein
MLQNFQDYRLPKGNMKRPRDDCKSLEINWALPKGKYASSCGPWETGKDFTSLRFITQPRANTTHASYSIDRLYRFITQCRRRYIAEATG